MAFNIKEIRKEKKLTQEELAEKSGVSRQTIITLESNPDAITTTDTLSKLAAALDVKVSSFFTQYS